ncbi:hypothetical protein NIES4102_00750 [Chondrocystis sp. NIES-4102]|nr:hypothetical protein NIES4102_00750 [Chondrocystis sp. NIES-4102]
MLLSHNFNLRNNELPALKREEFAQIFIDGFKNKDVTVSLIENPHWIVEIIFPQQKFTPENIGQICGEILTTHRKNQHPDSQLNSDTLILGGRKSTIAISNSPTALQMGEWGVDVVETKQADIFLAEINWENLSASKTSDSVFKIEIIGTNK